MRRHHHHHNHPSINTNINGSNNNNEVEESSPSPSPSSRKERVRRRLFQSSSPVFVKPRQLFLSTTTATATATTISPTTTTTSSRRHYYFKSRKQSLITFGCFAILVLLSVHLYLFYSVLLRNEENNSGSASSNTIVDFHDFQLRQQQQQKPQTKRDGSNNNIRKINKSTETKKTSSSLEPLRPIDYEQYTIRINTWKRPEQLLLSVEHHISCPGVAQIQIVWCDPDEEPPVELYTNYIDNTNFTSTTTTSTSKTTYPKLVIEKHSINTLNERFRIITETPTLGILSIDDDVLRPCEAIDSGFFRWTSSPNRMVGFDGRIHTVVDEHNNNNNDNGSTKTTKWKYGYMSTTEKANKYSLSLTRYCFIHRNYMDWYISELPNEILNFVAKNFNCEDIAMSFMISSLTDGKPPLLANFWAIKSMIKLYVPQKISGGDNHKQIRDECVDTFATILGLKEGEDDGNDINHKNNHKNHHPLQMAKYMHEKDPLFSGGDNNEDHNQNNNQKKKITSDREKELQSLVENWHQNVKNGHMEYFYKELTHLKSYTAYNAYKHGMIENTDTWKQRFGKK